MMTRLLRFACFCLSLLVLVTCAPAEKAPIFVWHAYRGNEAKALEQLSQDYGRAHGVRIELLALPYSAYASKLEAAIPHGHGPDVFIDAHERLASYHRNHLVAPATAAAAGDFDASVLDPLRVDGTLYGVPLASKCLALIVNEDLAPKSIGSMEGLLESPMPQGVYPLAYEAQSAYAHAAILHAWGGQMLRADGSFGMVGPEAEASLETAKAWSAKLAKEPDAALVTQLFTSGKAAAVISGPWFLADLGGTMKIKVLPLPMLAATGKPLRPFLTVEAAMLTPDGAKRSDVQDFVHWLATDAEALRVRSAVGKQVVASGGGGGESETTRAFRDAAKGAMPMPTLPTMRATWVPSEQALRKALRGDASPHDALEEAKARFIDAIRPPPPPPPKTPLLLVMGAALLLLTFRIVQRVREPGFRAELRASKPAYKYVTHAAVIVFALVVLPLIAGTATSFFAGTRSDPTYVGFANYAAILTARGGDLLGHGSFYLTLLVTILWTVLNVFFHVGIGMALALLLSREKLRLRPLYRTLLILPWAVPSYVTALSWKGMFHRQFGAINAILAALGAEPISWFAKFSTALAANVATNVWLGFPFMMVVTMGALTSIPKEVLEAAEVDGATPWQVFWRVKFPLLKPSLLPAVALGAVWTFNMFNVVFLVSGGEPDESTDILVSAAYRWAFTRDAQLGYAAAYAVMIFVLLFGTSRLMEWFGEKREGVEK